MPAITEIEWKKHFEESTRIKFEEIEKSIRNMGSNSVREFARKYSSFSKDFDNLKRDSFIRNMGRAKLERLPLDYPNDQLKKVFNKYFSKEKPFGANGKKAEFPDAFVLASLEKYAKTNNIDRIIVFANDKDITEYKSDCLMSMDPNTYLNDLVTTKIPELEQKETERISADISRLYRYLDSKPETLIENINKEIIQFLSDPTSYIDRFDYAEIDYISVDHIDLEISSKDLEIRSVNEDDIEVLCFADADAKVSVKHFNEDESIWDSEDKEYIYESYTTTRLDLSSVLPVTLLFPRMEKDEVDEQDEKTDIDVEISIVDFINLQDAIDSNYASDNVFEDDLNGELPQLIKDMTELKEKVNTMTTLLNKRPK